ncbi:MAG: hypothetical protein M1812_003996 [Candelaria pacifica]|nr:MAG: hypothetical protein M1812_003996 [Candelaria pacifica]
MFNFSDAASPPVATVRHISRRSPFTDQPAHIQLDYHFASVGDYGIELTINSRNSKAAYILTWNTIFEVPMPASQSISILPSGQGLATPERYLTSVHIDHRKVLARSFLKIPPVDNEGRGVTWYLDLRDDFYIQQGGSYQVKVQQQFRGFLAEDWDFKRLFEGPGLLQRSDMTDMPLMTLLDLDTTMSLRSSKDVTAGQGSRPTLPFLPVPPPVNSRDLPNTKCTSNKGFKVTDARIGTNKLAQIAGQSIDTEIWTQYYNGHQAIWDAINRGYANIEAYKGEYRNFGVFERCPSPTDTLLVTPKYGQSNQVPWCPPDRATFLVQHRGSSDSILGFCDLFFDLPELRECDSPSLVNNNMVDMTGVFLRGLGKAPNIGNAQILNGQPTNDYCYGWPCVTNAARFRPDFRWDMSSPATGASTFNYGIPENILDTFEQYAYAVRAKACIDKKNRDRPNPVYCKFKKGCKTGVVCAEKALKIAVVLLGATLQAVGTCAGDPSAGGGFSS